MHPISNSYRMQIFLPYPEPIMVARCLDKKRLNKQIIECDNIINAITGKSTAWKNHPVVHMYSNHLDFIFNYKLCLDCYRKGDTTKALIYNKYACSAIPSFITNDFCNQHKRRLYTKDSVHYNQFQQYGTSNHNWYIVDNVLLIYNNGKLVQKINHTPNQ